MHCTKRTLFIALWLGCLGLAVGRALALTVRVDPARGAPRLVVNGKAVRARLFFGIPGAGVIRVTPGAREETFDFTPNQDEPGGATMHFRFGASPGDLALDDIRVTDLQTGQDVLHSDFEGGADAFTRDWSVWPPDERNTVGTVRVEPGAGRDGSAGLHITIKAPPGGEWPDFHIYHKADLTLVKGHHYRVSFWVRSDAVRHMQVAFYRPGDHYVYLGGPPGPFETQIKMAAHAGVNLVSFPVGLPWPAPGRTADFASVDTVCDTVLRANPQALLLPRVPMDPPAWWAQAHPDDMMRWEDRPGQTPHRAVAVPASPRYRADAGARLAALIAHVEAKYGGHVAGYHPAGENTGEWFYEDAWGQALNGYAQADLAAWRAWLGKRYRTDDALRAAWHDPSASLQTVAVPTAAARHAAPAGVFRDPVHEKPLLDWAEFQQRMMADCVLHFAHVARQATLGRKLVAFFYGYVFEMGALPTTPGVSGHYALRRVLDSPDIDVLCSPISYFDRGLGGSAPSMTAAESVARAGKMWLNEDDTATYLSSGSFPGWQEKAPTPALTRAELTRNVGQEAVRNFATWWMDLGGTGWFADTSFWDEMARLNALDTPLLAHPTPFRPEIAAVLDERSLLAVADGAAVVTRPGIYEVRRPLGLLGAPYGQDLMDDVVAGRVSAKLYLFLDAWRLSAAQRTGLRRATRGQGRVWCYAPGFWDEDRPSPAAMRELTGFALTPVSPSKAWATPTALGRRLGLTQGFGVNGPVRPLFAASDAKPGEILMTYPDGSPAVALRRSPDGPSLFVGPPGLTSELLRLAAREAKVHLFTPTDCHVYANGPFVILHGAQDGTIRLDTGRVGPVRDVETGGVVGQGPRLSLPLRRGETRVLKLAP